MLAIHRARVPRGMRAVRGWAVWEHPRWLVAFIGLVVTAWAAGVALAARTLPISAEQALILGGLLLCSVGTVEMTRREGENAGLISDVFAVWELPVAVLLPPVYAMTFPLARVALTQWRVRSQPLHRRVFTAAVLGLSFGAASLAFHSVGPVLGVLPGRGLPWVLAVAAAGILQWSVNWVLLLPAIKGSNPGVRIRDLVPTREVIQNDVTELCVAVLVTCGIAISLLTILFALPFVTLLQRSFRHAYLVNASRVDSKTGLLNAGTWEREAATEVARAVRTRSPIAVALIDVDHFKAVNDAYGHLVGDKALQAIARALTVFLREYDLVGRFGGEEFALLLPQTKAVDAYRIAERIRTHIGNMPVAVGDADAGPVRISISIGVAAFGAKWDSNRAQLTELLAAADAALYQAKRDGRDQVCVVTENATFGSGAPAAPAERTGAITAAGPGAVPGAGTPAASGTQAAAGPGAGAPVPEAISAAWGTGGA